MNSLLKNLTGRVGTKVELGVPPESLVCGKGSDVLTLES